MTKDKTYSTINDSTKSLVYLEFLEDGAYRYVSEIEAINISQDDDRLIEAFLTPFKISIKQGKIIILQVLISVKLTSGYEASASDFSFNKNEYTIHQAKNKKLTKEEEEQIFKKEQIEARNYNIVTFIGAVAAFAASAFTLMYQNEICDLGNKIYDQLQKPSFVFGPITRPKELWDLSDRELRLALPKKLYNLKKNLIIRRRMESWTFSRPFGVVMEDILKNIKNVLPYFKEDPIIGPEVRKSIRKTIHGIMNSGIFLLNLPPVADIPNEEIIKDFKGLNEEINELSDEELLNELHEEILKDAKIFAEKYQDEEEEYIEEEEYKIPKKVIPKIKIEKEHKFNGRIEKEQIMDEKIAINMILTALSFNIINEMNKNE